MIEILCQAELVAESSGEDFAVNGLKTFNDTNGAVKAVLQWAFSDRIVSKLPDGKTPYKPNDIASYGLFVQRLEGLKIHAPAEGMPEIGLPRARILQLGLERFE